MSNLTPWTKEGREAIWSDLQNSMTNLQKEINSAFGTALGNWGNIPMESERFFKRFIPSVNIRENDKEITISAEIPGLDEKNIHVTHTDHELILEGEKKMEKRDEKDKDHVIESSYGSFRRVISLPSEIDFTKINAAFKNGVLTVTLPKTEKAKQNIKKVEIKAG